MVNKSLKWIFSNTGNSVFFIFISLLTVSPSAFLVWQQAPLEPQQDFFFFLDFLSALSVSGEVSALAFICADSVRCCCFGFALSCLLAHTSCPVTISSNNTERIGTNMGPTNGSPKIIIFLRITEKRQKMRAN